MKSIESSLVVQHQPSRGVGWLLVSAGTVFAWGSLQPLVARVLKAESWWSGDPLAMGVGCASGVACIAVGVWVLLSGAAQANAAVQIAVTTQPPPVQEAAIEVSEGLAIDVTELPGFQIGGCTGGVNSYVVHDSMSAASENPLVHLTAGARLVAAQEAAASRFVIHRGQFVDIGHVDADRGVIARIGEDASNQAAA